MDKEIILPVFKITLDNDCLDCGVQSIELVSNPINEFIIKQDGTTTRN